jgi:protein TonB
MSALMPGRDDRAFHYAVLASVALHGAALLAFPGLRVPARPAVAVPIVARLLSPEPSSAPAPAPAVEPRAAEVPLPRAQKPPPTRPAPAAKPRPVAKPAPEAAPAPPQPSPAPREAETQAPAETVPAAAPAPAPEPAGGAVAKAESGAATAAAASALADAGSLAQYRLQLIGAARKYKRYPRAAMDNNWEGDVVVRMVIGADGSLSALTVKSSSGHEILDRQALDMFKRAKSLVQIPPALRGREFAIELRAIYNLRDQESS